MKVLYTQINPADCTSDPHPVTYDVLTQALDDIVRVCASDMVQAVEEVSGRINDIEYESDSYIHTDYPDNGAEPASGKMAEKHKTSGLYFYGDAEEGKAHLPPGFTGVKEFVKQAKKALKSGPITICLRVDVVWKFAGQSSCSDNIELGPDGYELISSDGEIEINFGSQDWWRSSEGYLDWCQQMADFLNKPFPYDNGDSDGIKQPNPTSD